MRLDETKPLTLRVWATLNKVKAPEARYFKSRLMGTIVDGSAGMNYCTEKGVYLSPSEFNKLADDRGLDLSNDVITSVAVHELIHFDARHVWGTMFVMKHCEAHRPAELKPRMTILNILHEWYANKHMFEFADKHLGLSKNQKGVMMEIGQCYETAQAQVLDLLGAHKDTSSVKVALTINLPDAEQAAQDFEDAKQSLSAAAQELMEAMGEVSPEGSAQGDTPNTTPSDKEMDNAGMTDNQRKQHEGKVLSEAKDSGHIAGGHIDDATGFLVEAMKVKLDPAALFRDYLKKTNGGRRTNWMKPRAAYRRMGVYMPKSYDVAIDNIGIMVDTSGSMGSDELSQAVGVIHACAHSIKFKRMVVMSVDTAVRKIQEVYTRDEIQGAVTLSGGGGTDFEAGFKAIAEQSVDVMFVVTDGGVHIAPEQNPGKPVVWVLTDASYTFEPPFGKVITVEVAE